MVKCLYSTHLHWCDLNWKRQPHYIYMTLMVLKAARYQFVWIIFVKTQEKCQIIREDFGHGWISKHKSRFIFYKTLFTVTKHEKWKQFKRRREREKGEQDLMQLIEEKRHHILHSVRCRWQKEKARSSLPINTTHKCKQSSQIRQFSASLIESF